MTTTPVASAPASPCSSSSAPGSEAGGDDVDVDAGWGSDLERSSSSSSSFSNDEFTDAFAVGDAPGRRRSSTERHKKPAGSASSPLRLRGRHGRKDSVADVGDQSARAYGEALRSVRASAHRASISVAPQSSAPLSEATRRRHRESKRRMESADRTQKLLFQAQELDAFMASLALWLHASIVPPRWRRQIADHLTQIHAQTRFCRDRVVAAWRLLLPPFDDANLREYETRLAQLDKSVAHLEAAIGQCHVLVADGERESAAAFLQLWYRRALARRKFYTKTLQVTSRHARGLVPGLFDTITANSKLTVDRGNGASASPRTTLEYPRSPAVAKHAFLS